MNRGVVAGRLLAAAFGLSVLLTGILPPAHANATITRTFTPRFSTNDTGDITMAANGLETCPAGAANCLQARAGTAVGGNLDDNAYVMEFIDVDADATTFDSSTADLVLPGGSTVLFAGLYWGGTTIGATAPPAVAAKGTVKFKTPGGGAYQTINSTQTDLDAADPRQSYQGFADVTSLVSVAGAGTYTVANVQAARGANMDAGWTLVVAYRDPTQPPRNLTLFDGFVTVNNALQPVTTTVTGFLTPINGPVDTKVGVVATDGDAGLTGDNISLNGTTLTNGLNPKNNFFNSTITNLGNPVVNRNPAYPNTLGLDADIVSAKGILANGATSATISLTTGGETYWPGVLTFVTDLYAPKIDPTKTVTDVNGGAIERGDVLRYTVDAANTGQDAAAGVVITDAIPAHTTYVPGSLNIVSGPNAGAKSDSVGNDQAEFDAGLNRVVFRLGVGADGTSGGTLAAVGHPNDQSVFTFDVRVDAAAPGGTSISNLAHADYFGVTLGPGNPLQGSASTPTTSVVADADLALTKSVDIASPNVGDLVTYTISLLNNGPARALSTVVADPIPAGTTFVSASPTVGTYSAGTGNWTVGTLASGATAGLTIQVRVAAAGLITNVAAATSSTPDPDPANNTASITIPQTTADLAVTKTVSAATAPVGSNVTYTVHLANLGPNTATNITVADLVPAGTTLVGSAPASGAYNPATGVWTVASLANGASTTLDLTVTVTTAGSHLNVAQVTGEDQVDLDPSNNRGTASVDGQTADLAVTKTVDNPNPVIGNTIAYTVRVTNNGPAAAAGTIVSDPIPAGASFVSAAATAGAYNAITGIWTIGTLASGATQTLTLQVKINTAAKVVNTATASSHVLDPDLSNNSDTIVVPNPVANLSVTKTVTPAVTAVGTNVTYTITLANGGPSAATSIVVDETLPAGLSVVSGTPSAGSYNSTTGAWTVASLANGASETLTLVATVTAVGPLTNHVAIVGLDQVDPVSSNDSASATVTGQTADLAITKTVSDPNANLGDTISYQVQVTNNGPAAATGVTVNDLLPAGVTHVSHVAGVGTYTPGTGVWAIGNLANGAVATLTITVSVDVTTAVTNAATVTSNVPDPDLSNNTASAAIASQTADLSVGKTVDNATPTIGQTVTFSLHVTNGGPNTAPGVQLTDQLPSGLTFVSATPSAGTYNPATGIWNVGSIAAAATDTLSISARVSGTGSIMNTLEVTASGVPDPDSTPGNHNPNEDDQASVTLTVPPSADLSLTKVASSASVVIGAPLTFTLVVSNAGPDGATGVTVSDPLAAGFTFVSATDDGSYDSTSGVWTIGSIASGSHATLVITVHTTALGNLSNSAEISHSDQADPNSTPGNNVPGEDDQALAGITVTAAPTPPPTANLPLVPTGSDGQGGLLVIPLLAGLLGAAFVGLRLSRRGATRWALAEPAPVKRRPIYRGAHPRR